MTKNPILLTLQLSALVLGLLAVVQTVLGGILLTGRWVESHQMFGFATLLVAVVAAVAAFLWMRRSGNKGLFMHATGLAVFALVQVGLGEAGLESLHVALGVLILVGAIALATLSYRKPGAVTEPVGTDRLS